MHSNTRSTIKAHLVCTCAWLVLVQWLVLLVLVLVLLVLGLPLRPLSHWLPQVKASTIRVQVTTHTTITTATGKSSKGTG